MSVDSFCVSVMTCQAHCLAPIVGGNWNNASNAGVFTRNWLNHRSNANNNNGFRVGVSLDSVSQPNPDTPNGDTGNGGSFLSWYSTEINGHGRLSNLVR